MGKSQREKGKRGERELAGKLRDHGYDCRRGQQFCGISGDADVIGLPGIHIECKRVERLNLQEAMEQSKRDARTGEKPCVFHRRDRSEWLVTMRLEDWIQLYKEWEAGQQITEGKENAKTAEASIRLSIGTEHIDDIIADLEAGFAAVRGE